MKRRVLNTKHIKCLWPEANEILFSISAQAAEVELTFWNFWDPKLILPVIEAFEKENPGVKIHNEQLTWNNGLDKIVVAMANLVMFLRKSINKSQTE